jgi:ubiquinone/menaquinone biosynthesis C-methylase UbiE
MLKLPYFDYLLALLESGDESLAASFGRHVHWGYWQNPKAADLTLADFALAAENLSAQVCQAGQIQAGQSVLDTGCGFGGTIAHLNDHYHAMPLTGLNLDERQLKRASALVTGKNDNQIKFIQGDACALPFADSSFDRVLAVECIFHFPDRKRYFQEVWRILKPGGFLALSDFVASPLLQPLMRLSFNKGFSASFYGECDLSYTLNHYRQLSRELGFIQTIERDITVNTLPTYRFLKKLKHLSHRVPKRALLETAAIEIASHLRMIHYCIFAFQKPK